MLGDARDLSDVLAWAKEVFWDTMTLPDGTMGIWPYPLDVRLEVAEALVEYDELFQKFRANHIYLIQRSIGLGSKSLKGRPVELLQAGTRHRFFPDLWDIRADMTDRWGSAYGVVRDSISKHDDAAE